MSDRHTPYRFASYPDTRKGFTMPDDKERPAGLLVSARRLAERYERSTRTIDRWVEVGVLPPPDLYSRP